MPKPLLNHQQNQNQFADMLSAVSKPKAQYQDQQMNKMQVDRILRNKRSKKYMDAIHKLDAGGHVHNQKQVDDIIDAIREEFPEVELHGVLLGIISECYLGKPYEVHIVDMVYEIIEHYKAGEPLPGALEKARALAIRGGYEFIEVYSNCCRCIGSMGEVSVIQF